MIGRIGLRGRREDRAGTGPQLQQQFTRRRRGQGDLVGHRATEGAFDAQQQFHARQAVDAGILFQRAVEMQRADSRIHLARQLLHQRQQGRPGILSVGRGRCGGIGMIIVVGTLVSLGNWEI